MRIDILTLFPQMFEAVLDDSIIGRAQAAGTIELNYFNIRDFSTDKHRRVDDYPYGGGNGLVMQAEPIYNAYKSIIDTCEANPFVIYLSPQGKVFDQNLATWISQKKHIILICGHYEGIDERIIEEIVDMEISMGDFVLTGGEIPAMALADAVCRLVPGVLSSEESFSDESHFNGLLEYPQYTRPVDFMGRKVPNVLLSGHHKNITEWRKQQSIQRTQDKRPDLFKKYIGSEEK